MNDAPCRNCESRSVGCHGECQVYLEWRRDLDEASDKKKKDDSAVDFLARNSLSKKMKVMRGFGKHIKVGNRR